MSTIKNVYAVADCAAAEKELARTASVFDGEVTMVVCREGNFLNAVQEILKVLETAAPDVVLTMSTRNGRLIAGLAAAKFGTTVLSDASEVTSDGDGIHTARLVYGGAAVRKECAAGKTAVLCVTEGTVDGLEAAVTVVEVQAAAEQVKVIEKRSKEAQSVNLNAAKHVVCAGRGVKDETVLAVLTEIAELIDAEMGCTRPVAEENHWMPRERYIGVSGAMIKPEVYLAVGVSGQMQHMVGCAQAGTIFAINKDKDSLVFKNCDYGIVGDAAVILPMIAERLK